jgi:hypothetical protein
VNPSWKMIDGKVNKRKENGKEYRMKEESK